jgi:predicted dinucleotide-binding enzyme
MRIAVLGSGRLGGTLASAWAQAGHQVVIGSRSGNRELDGVAVLTIPDAARDADVVVNATPGAHAVELLTAQPDGWLDGRVLLDVSNIDEDSGDAVPSGPSIAERLQDAFPRAAVVKSLNTFSRTVMVDPDLLPQRTTIFVSGESPQAKALVATLLRDLGWGPNDILDLGGIRTARAVEHMIRMYYALRDSLGTRDFNIRVVTRPQDDGQRSE